MQTQTMSWRLSTFEDMGLRLEGEKMDKRSSFSFHFISFRFVFDFFKKYI